MLGLGHVPQNSRDKLQCDWHPLVFDTGTILMADSLTQPWFDLHSWHLPQWHSSRNPKLFLASISLCVLEQQMRCGEQLGLD